MLFGLNVRLLKTSEFFKGEGGALETMGEGRTRAIKTSAPVILSI